MSLDCRLGEQRACRWGEQRAPGFLQRWRAERIARLDALGVLEWNCEGVGVSAQCLWPEDCIRDSTGNHWCCVINVRDDKYLQAMGTMAFPAARPDHALVAIVRAISHEPPRF